MKKLKIAIFSGVIPSTTFIEYLIQEVGGVYQVLLFGTVEKKVKYGGNCIKLYPASKSHIKNLWVNILRSFKLIIRRPRDFFKLLHEIKRYKAYYDKWVWFTKFLPIVLYKPDILHLQWARDIEFYGFLQDDFNIKLVLSLRGAHINYTPILQPMIADIYRNTFPKVKGFHAVSNAISKEAQAYGAEISKIRMIHSPLNVNTINNFHPKQRVSSDPIKLISIGRFHWVKGLKYSIQACDVLKNKGVDFEYIIVADHLAEEVRFQINQLNLKEEIKVVPFLTQDELFRMMKEIDVLILPSLKEGIANVVLESMALGVPVISTDCGGMSEVVIPNETGWLVPTRNPQAIANAVREVINTPPQELYRITKNAHNFVKEHFNAEQSIKQFLELYDAVMAKDDYFVTTRRATTK
ncbi:glycosyltransferase family 4 protein [Mangrovimonas aestuarii]|uniref:glycosyltransferase family 4 protein n=1 Tax=Mangrovimonas aestuarii TaxID=3018443 RepID=UPI0023788B7E|nr:glycosyltransferase family 4 protein [Mangrovimonas aestuarii]